MADRAAAEERAVTLCGRPRGHVVPLGAVAPPAGMSRDLEFERRWTRQAAEVAHVDPEPLIRFAETRARPGGVTGLPGRDLVLEVLEELADARNYLVWAIREHYQLADVDGDRVAALGHALTTVASAFTATARARGSAC